MARPKSKKELLDLSQENFDKLMSTIEKMDNQEQKKEFPPGTLNRNLRDVLTHLHHWHLLLMGWYETGMSGNKPKMPAEGYTWKTLPDLNRWIREYYLTSDLDQAKELFRKSHLKVRKLIEGHSEKELFEKKRYAWTGSTSLGAYLISATSSHYDWALKLIRKAKK